MVKPCLVRGSIQETSLISYRLRFCQPLSLTLQVCHYRYSLPMKSMNPFFLPYVQLMVKVQVRHLLMLGGQLDFQLQLPFCYVLYYSMAESKLQHPFSTASPAWTIGIRSATKLDQVPGPGAYNSSSLSSKRPTFRIHHNYNPG